MEIKYYKLLHGDCAICSAKNDQEGNQKHIINFSWPYVPFVVLLHIVAQNLIMNFEMPFVSKFRFLITLPKIEINFLDIVY